MGKGGRNYKRWIGFIAAVGLSFSILSGCDEMEENLKRVAAADEGKEGVDTSWIHLEGDYQPSSFTQADVNSDTIRWMCSAYSIYTYYNDKELGIVGGIKEEDRDVNQRAIRIALSQGWGIDGRKDVERVLTDLIREGHSAEYHRVIGEMEEEGLLDLSEEEAMAQIPLDEDYYRYQAAYLAYEKYGESGIEGWDYTRALQILGDCYQAEYINLEECLDLSLPIAQMLQADYEDWEGVAKSYLYGYQFWKKEDKEDKVTDTNDQWEIYQELAAMKSGPYSVPFDTALENTWADGGAGQAEKEKMEGKGDVLKADEYLYVYVKVPEEFEEESFSDEENRRYTKEKEEGFGELRFSYRLSAYAEDSVKNAEESARIYMETAQNDSENEDVTVSELSERAVGDVTVHYVTYSYTFKSIKTRYYKSWAELDEDKLLTCEVRETVSAEDELEYGDDGAVLDLAYSDISW